MALDLGGAFSPQVIAEYVTTKELPEKTGQSAGALAKWLSGIRGIRLGIRIGTMPSASVAVDFMEEVPIDAEQAKSLILDALADGGMSIGGLEEWQPAVSGKMMSIRGYLTTDGLRRVLSVIDSPTPDKTQPEQTAETASPGALAAQKVANSLEYFKAINTMFEDLKKDMKNSKNLASTSLWFDKYAKKIDRLPILNVDEDLLNYGAYVATQMRNAAGSVRTMGIRSGARTSQITPQSIGPTDYYGGYRYGRYGWYGGGVAVYNPQDTIRQWDSERRAIRGQEKGKMATDVNSIREEVIQATADVRREMTQRYQVEF
jgi:hypothetical protein